MQFTNHIKKNELLFIELEEMVESPIHLLQPAPPIAPYHQRPRLTAFPLRLPAPLRRPPLPLLLLPPLRRRRPAHGHQHVRPAQRATRPPLRRAFIRGCFFLHMLGNGRRGRFGRRRQGFQRVDALGRTSPAAVELGGDDGGVWTELGIRWEWQPVNGRAQHFGCGYERGWEMGKGGRSSYVGNGLCLEILSPFTRFGPQRFKIDAHFFSFFKKIRLRCRAINCLFYRYILIL